MINIESVSGDDRKINSMNLDHDSLSIH